MSDSLRDQLLKMGLAKATAKPVSGTLRPGQPPARRRVGKKTRSKPADTPAVLSGEIDLARAWAMRERQERTQRATAKREAAEQVRKRRQIRDRLQHLIDGQVCNKPAEQTELQRHFEYGGKIRRVHVDADQLQALNNGVLGVIQLSGRYLLLDRNLVEQARSFAPHLVALLVDPDEASDKQDDIEHHP